MRISDWSSDVCSSDLFGQVAHVDLSRDWAPYKLRNALNAHLSMARERVCVLDVMAVAESFDARFSALRRHYLYRVVNRPDRKSVVEGKCVSVRVDLGGCRIINKKHMNI